jgi:hypothetical protein
LVFLAQAVPPLAARRYTVVAGAPEAPPKGHASTSGTQIVNNNLCAVVDEKTGGISSLTAKGLQGDFVDATGGEALNEYLYLPGDDLKDLKRNGPVTIRVGEPGPLLASLIVESAAPGCKLLRRELRLVSGQDSLEIINLVDKARLPAKSYHAKEGKESLNFAFPFQVPDGRILLDLPLGVMRVEADQMPSACKNWLTAGRWADVAARNRGITWVTLDAPLVQVGGLTARLLNSQTNPDIWRKRIEPTQKLYSWAMNNHWGTNYRAYQDGPTTFRFVLRPHGRSTPADATRFSLGFSYPLLATPASGAPAPTEPLLRLDSEDVIVNSLKPADTGRALIVRLFGASGKTAPANIQWTGVKPKAVFLSGTSEKPGAPVTGPVTVPGYGLVTLRVELE